MPVSAPPRRWLAAEAAALLEHRPPQAADGIGYWIQDEVGVIFWANPEHAAATLNRPLVEWESTGPDTAATGHLCAAARRRDTHADLRPLPPPNPHRAVVLRGVDRLAAAGRLLGFDVTAPGGEWRLALTNRRQAAALLNRIANPRGGGHP